MNIFQAFLRGWLLVVRFPVYCLLKYGLTLIFAFLLLGPLTEALDGFLANREMMATELQNPSLGFIFEFVTHLDSGLSEITQSAMLMLVLFVVLNVFLSSGILHVFAQHQRGESISFMLGVRRHFLSLALFVLMFGAIIIFAKQGWDAFYGFLLGSYPPVWVEIVAAIFQIWLLWFAWLVYDMTRVIVCAVPLDHSSGSMSVLMSLVRPITSLFRALVFVFSKPSIWIVSLAFLLIQAFWALGIQRGWFSVSGVGVLLFGQLIVLARTATSLAMWGAETALWVGSQASKSVPDHGTSVFEPSYAETDPPEQEMETQPESEAAADLSSPEPIDPADPYDEDEAYLSAGRSATPTYPDPDSSSSEESNQGSGN